MSALKDLRNRIKSIRSVRKITSSMKMVSVSKMRRFQPSFEMAKDVMGVFEAAMALLDPMDLEEIPLLMRPPPPDGRKGCLYVVVTSERGLCGGFNSNIIRTMVQEAKAQEQLGNPLNLICAGKKGASSLQNLMGGLILDSFENLEKNAEAVARTVARTVVMRFKKGLTHTCKIIYTHFRSVASQEVNVETLAPFLWPPRPVLEEIPLIEPDAGAVLEALLPLYLEAKLLFFLKESLLSEQAARMMAMDNATRSADDMIERLELLCNRTRQANITRELTEIIAGAQAIT